MYLVSSQETFRISCNNYILNKKRSNAYISNFRVSDLADLLLYIVYLKKVKNIELDGFDYLLTYKEEGMEEVDQYSFTNTFLYIQQSKEVKIEF